MYLFGSCRMARKQQWKLLEGENCDVAYLNDNQNGNPITFESLERNICFRGGQTNLLWLYMAFM